MPTFTGAFQGFSANDIEAEKAFYSGPLGLTVHDEMGGLDVELPGGSRLYIYPKENHEPATFTVLNLQVTDIDATVDELVAKGVTFERYEGTEQDERGIQRAYGPAIAWFEDPCGNILSVLQEQPAE
jgi:catechol 2,3-dioxygenase-like lactoylglutathione lyase family enzyme